MYDIFVQRMYIRMRKFIYSYRIYKRIQDIFPHPHKYILAFQYTMYFRMLMYIFCAHHTYVIMYSVGDVCVCVCV